MLLRKIARPLLAAWFISDGVDAVRHPAAHVETARGPVDQLTSLTGRMPLTDRQVKTLVQAHGAATAAAGLSLAVGRAPRTSALVLAALALPLAVADEPFTRSDVPRSVRIDTFARRLGAVGAAVLAGIDTEGRPGIAWRVEKSKEAKAAARAAEVKG